MLQFSNRQLQIFDSKLVLKVPKTFTLNSYIARVEK